MGAAPFTMRQGLALDQDDFKEAYVSGRLVIDCVEITFTQNDSESPRIYAARGCIQLSPERGVEARLVCPRDAADPYDPMAFFTRSDRFTPGVLLPPSHYYQLSARDVAGNWWTHPSIDLKVEDSPDVVVLSFSCDRIQTVAALEGARPHAFFVFLDELAFPENTRRTTKVESGGEIERSSTRIEGSKGWVAGMKVSYDKRKNVQGERYSEFVAVAQEGHSLPLNFQDRLLEAVRFCTATMALPVMTETVLDGLRTIELAQSRPLNDNSMVHAPISTSRPDAASDFYKLFECYFEYACANGAGKEFAPISSKLGGIFTLKGVWLDTIVLLLGVAVEAILNESKIKGVVEHEASLADDIPKLIEAISTAQVGTSLAKRAIGAVSTMSSASAADKLNALVKVGALEEDDRKAWGRLRNKAAHGSFAVDPKKMQKVLDDVFRLTTLIYKLVFLLIGYSGKYSNRAPRGWREDQFDAPTYWKALETRLADEDGGTMERGN